MRALFDTSVLVAALEAALPDHKVALPWLQRAHGGEITLLISAHTLAEVFSTLTVLPLSPRLSPAKALRLIEENIARHAEMVPLAPEDYLAALQRAPGLDVAGGTIYDALIARAAAKANADILLTLNPRHFLRVWPEGQDKIRTP